MGPAVQRLLGGTWGTSSRLLASDGIVVSISVWFQKNWRLPGWGARWHKHAWRCLELVSMVSDSQPLLPDRGQKAPAITVLLAAPSMVSVRSKKSRWLPPPRIASTRRTMATQASPPGQWMSQYLQLSWGIWCPVSGDVMDLKLHSACEVSRSESLSIPRLPQNFHHSQFSILHPSEVLPNTKVDFPYNGIIWVEL